MTQITPKALEFLLLFKETDVIARRQVYSWPSLYRLMDARMIEYREGPHPEQNTYHITAFGRDFLTALSNGEQK